ncbi:class I SAM-dependent methyltransferase [Aequorivita sp. SDUM287046]|uniref:Class I SAM-dependent methyltransferase n=1 Tax=Aequorivita aurantiaca TaxID=3053356 RepID=A0ABT8DEQ8_9FLAO|nr:class I SAM-dependent methyltransferase [Aequorivita aurantiaca]MDN3723084.1 class I SAM-dependent methyltransferase [Aequorivita aurantiaca]
MKNSETFITTKDYLISKKSFDLVYNANLEMLRTNPQPNTDELYKYYESSEYISHTDERRDFFSRIYQVVKQWSLHKKTNLIYELNGSAGDLLDIGAGTGEFLKSAEEKGWKVFGVEPNEGAKKRAINKGLDLKSSINEFEGKRFDVVTLWHVLEHIPNLEDTISQLTHLVKTDGTLIIAVPNYRSFDAKYYGKFWAAYDVPRHLWHFSKKSIEKLFQPAFILKEIKPMIFDSFYVSLLSEKYRTGKKFSVKGIWIGLLSNLKGIFTKEFSSHIYCFKKGDN